MALSTHREHFYPIDLMRALTVVGVISVHSVFFTNPSTSVTAGGVISLLHYTRELFLFITGFVLIYSYWGKRWTLKSFWRKRFALIGIPYVLWSALYTVIHTPPHSLMQYMGTLGVYLLTGQAWYHLYYLLVTMQIYLCFPWLIKLLEWSRGHHRWLFAISLALEIGLMTLYQYHLPTRGVWGWLANYRNMSVFTYQFYLITGALFALHLPQWQKWVETHGRSLKLGLIATAMVALTWYGVAALGYHQSIITASAVLQPFMVPYCLAVILVLFGYGLAWSRVRRNRPWDRAVMTISKESFGIYLIHHLILWMLLQWVLPRLTHLPQLLITITAIALTLFVSQAIVRMIAATPASLYALGHPPQPWPWPRLVPRLQWNWGPSPRRQGGVE